MSRAASIIEINGTTYDAATGNVIGAVRRVATQVKDQSRAIDGFVRKPAHSRPIASAAAEPKPEARPVKTAKQIHSRTQRSHALMRHVVTRPKAQVLAAKQGLIKPSLSKVVGAEQERRSRAQAITRDARVKRFGGRTKTVASQREQIVAKARPLAAHQTASATISAPLPSMVASASHQRLERLLDEALVQADAHKKSMKKKSHGPLARFNRLPRWLTIAIVLLALVLAASLVAWRDVPQVAIKVAGKQAHVSAGLPAYTPSGFATGAINHQNGMVTIQYKNAAGGYSYDLTQRNSSWDSTSLAANVLKPGSQVQTSQVQGTTVYIYGKQNDATWVNNGIWYTLKNNASLSSDQILHIVQSL